MTRQELLDRLLRMKAENENMDLPVMVRVDPETGIGTKPVYGELTHCCAGTYGMPHSGGVYAGLLIARKIIRKAKRP